MKRSVSAEQTLDFNSIDFERTGKTRKTSYKFNLEFNNGKPRMNIPSSDLAASLVAELLQDSVTKTLLLLNDYEFTFNTKFQLHIKNKERTQYDLPAETNNEKEHVDINEEAGE